MSALFFVLLNTVKAEFASDLTVASSAAASLNSQVQAWSAADGLIGALGIQNGFPALSTAVVALSNDGKALQNSDIDVSSITGFSASVADLLQSLAIKAQDFTQVGAASIVSNDIQSLGSPAVGILSEILSAVSGDCDRVSSLLTAYNNIVNFFSSADGAYSLSNPSFPAFPTCTATGTSSAQGVSTATSAPTVVATAPVVSGAVNSSAAVNATTALPPPPPVVSSSARINSTWAGSEAVRPSATTSSPIIAGNSSAVPGYVNTTTVDTTKWVTIPCSTPTTVTYGGSTYTVSHATTLTVKDCGCTDTVPGATPSGKPSAPGGTVAPVSGSSGGVVVSNNGVQTAVGFSAAILGVVALLV